MDTIYIDGASGTTGLRLAQRLRRHADIRLIELPPEERRCADARRRAMAQAALTVLCLPDAAAREAAALAAGTGTRLIDASSAHRTAPDWLYGMPELTPDAPDAIAHAKRVSVPGCHATGFILAVRPLTDAGLLPKNSRLEAFSITGYSGGGKAMIARYESPDRAVGDALCAPRPYALGQQHKHLPEMKAFTGLDAAPVFLPTVGSFRCGMLVAVPMTPAEHGFRVEDVLSLWRERYAGLPTVRILEPEAFLDEDGSADPARLAGRDGLELSITGHDDRAVLLTRYDNLGKGASGTALECINLMLGRPVDAGLAL